MCIPAPCPLNRGNPTFTSQPSWDDLVGALSIIIWSLTLIVTIKYTVSLLLLLLSSVSKHS